MTVSIPGFPFRRRGAILLMVLGFIFLASVFTVALLESMTRHMRAAATAAARDDLRIAAFSGMQVALASLAEIKELDGELYSPSQGWGSPMDYAAAEFPSDVQVTIKIEDETGKIPLNAEDRNSLRLLFEQLGVDITESEELIDAYLDWTDEDDLERLNGAEEDYYSRLEPPRTPPNEPVTSFDSFRYIKGFDELFFDENGAPNPLFRRFKDSVTLTHDEKPNINTVSPTVRAMLADDGSFDEYAFEDLQLGLDGVAGTDDDGYIKSQDDLESLGLSAEDGFGFESKVFRITVTVEQGLKVFQLTAVVREGRGSSRNDDNSGQNDDERDGGASPPGAEGRRSLPVSEIEVRRGNEDNSNRRGRSSTDEGGAGADVLYQIGDWSFLELTENGSEDG